MPTTQELARQIRHLIIQSVSTAGSGHPGGSLGITDLLSVLYFDNILHIDPQSPLDPNRDRFILSAGHLCPALYATLAVRGFFPTDELMSLRQFGSRLQGHPHKDFSKELSPKPYLLSPDNLPGIENTAGPLGQGTSFAVGVALGLKAQFDQGKLDRLPHVYCLCGDGELEEGQCWEAFMAASKFKLANLTFVVDRNHIQIDGTTETVMPLEPLKDKLNSFGLRTIEIDGHNHQQITKALNPTAYPEGAPLGYSKTSCILARTIPGKGVSFMENQYIWHGKAPNQKEAAQALQEIDSC